MQKNKDFRIPFTDLKNSVLGRGYELSLVFIDDKFSRKLNKQYRNKEGTTNILSFPLAEGEQSVLPNDISRLGDIIISYPMVIKEASQYEMLVDERIDELVKHGMLHLLGLHHE